MLAKVGQGWPTSTRCGPNSAACWPQLLASFGGGSGARVLRHIVRRRSGRALAQQVRLCCPLARTAEGNLAAERELLSRDLPLANGTLVQPFCAVCIGSILTGVCKTFFRRHEIWAVHLCSGSGVGEEADGDPSFRSGTALRNRGRGLLLANIGAGAAGSFLSLSLSCAQRCAPNDRLSRPPRGPGRSAISSRPLRASSAPQTRCSSRSRVSRIPHIGFVLCFVRCPRQ